MAAQQAALRAKEAQVTVLTQLAVEQNQALQQLGQDALQQQGKDMVGVLHGQ